MFKKILIANSGARGIAAVAPATNCLQAGFAGLAGEFTVGEQHV